MEVLTDLPVRKPIEAIEKINWYAKRWKIELFHKILKSGRKAEDSRLRTADRLANLLALFCILSRRILWLTMINRVAPDGAPGTALPRTEISLLDQTISDTGNRKCLPGTLAFCLAKLARLEGYLARIHYQASSSFGAASPDVPISSEELTWPDFEIVGNAKPTKTALI